MNNYTRSKKSTEDIQKITKRSMEDFGETQTLQYMAGLKERMQLLADRPDIGRGFLHTRTEQHYLFFRYESHVTGRHLVKKGAEYLAKDTTGNKIYAKYQNLNAYWTAENNKICAWNCNYFFGSPSRIF